MVTCQNQKAASHALPRGPAPVEDRRVTLEIQCREDGSHSSTLKSVGSGRDRNGGALGTFELCENHNQLFQMIDAELVEDGWASSYMGKKPSQH